MLNVANEDESYLTQILPRKYGNKERFRADEVMEILGYKDERTLTSKDNELKPVRTGDKKKIYLRENLEAYLKKLNS